MPLWEKGQSANPGGRPKRLAEVEELARSHTTTAINALAAIVKNPKQHASARVKAAEVLLDRGYGKPRQDMRIQQVDEFDGVTDEALREQVVAVLTERDRKVARRHRGDPGTVH